MAKTRTERKSLPYPTHEEATAEMFREDPELAAEYLHQVLAEERRGVDDLDPLAGEEISQGGQQRGVGRFHNRLRADSGCIGHRAEEVHRHAVAFARDLGGGHRDQHVWRARRRPDARKISECPGRLRISAAPW